MADNVADLTLAHVRKIDQTVSVMWEVLQRNEALLERIERGVRELKRDIRGLKRESGKIRSDRLLRENRLLDPLDEIFLWLTERVKEHDQRLDALELAIEPT